MVLKLGFSTCPNDTFIFDALVHHKIDTEGLEFEIILADVEVLNTMALSGNLDVTKMSYHAYAYVSDMYQLLNSGSALGRNNGPLLISKTKYTVEDIPNLRIAIPGEKTTANLLLKTAFPKLKSLTPVLFSEIEQRIIADEYDAGLIIHESRFTYHEKGLLKILDLGEFWEKTTKSPIPLGGIVIKRHIDETTKAKFARVLHRSVLFAKNNPEEPIKYMQKYAQDMASDIMKKHVELYVNEFTLSLDLAGQNAVELLYKKAYDLRLIPNLPVNIFLTKTIVN